MKKILKLILIAIAITAVLVFAFLAYMGMIFPLKSYETQMGPYTLVYESFVGPYAQTGPVFDKVYKALKAEGIETTLGLGIYYDEPGKVPADKLRSDCGVVVEKKDLAKLYRVQRKFNVKRLRQRKSIVVEFPLRNMLSYMLGPMRGYPALIKHAEQNGYRPRLAYELYDEKQKKIFFVMRIVK
ncbi:MAG: GyrI-like domain-containing protein [bacterium]